MDMKSEVIIFKPSIEAQKLQRFTSEVLWHFVGRGKTDDERYQTLLSILRTGLKIGRESSTVVYYAPKTDGKNLDKVELDAYPVSCLADIPLKDLPIHEQRYGQYAIGFHKTSAVNFGFMPVLYAHQFSQGFRRFMTLLEEIGVFLEKTDAEVSKKYDELRYLLGSITKTGWLSIAPHLDEKVDKEQLQNYYYEREWRSLHDWGFQPVDVAAIIVPDNRLESLLKDLEGQLRPFKKTVTMPFSMVHRL